MFRDRNLERAAHVQKSETVLPCSNKLVRRRRRRGARNGHLMHLEHCSAFYPTTNGVLLGFRSPRKFSSLVLEHGDVTDTASLFAQATYRKHVALPGLCTKLEMPTEAALVMIETLAHDGTIRMRHGRVSATRFEV
jgi:hypothetical protein